ncbi:hypothetical protein Adt_35470 [Abeliophyllum distichum]|uniref:Uncharacterized protein n=1 Tax=Abeliophyllum distichum TaxID=126358 RepID=A0ABD1QFP2_9LAMI
MVDTGSDNGPHEDQVVNNGSEDEDEDYDFYDSDNEVKDDGNLDFKANITSDNDFGPCVNFYYEKSLLYAPTFELHTDYSSNDGECVTYPEFVVARDMANPQFKMGLNFSSYLELFISRV